MFEKKDGYIQLPPLPENLDGKMVRLLWEYAKLPAAYREATYRQYQVLSKLERTAEEIDEASVYHVDPENIDAFLQRIRAIVSELFREAMGLSQYVYEECFVKGKEIEEILPDDDPRMEEALWSMYMLFLDSQDGPQKWMS